MTARVLVLSNYPAPYRQPLFAALAEQLRPQIELSLYYNALESQQRNWRVATARGGYPVYDGGGRVFRPPGKEFEAGRYAFLWRTLRAQRPDLVIVDGFSIGAMKVLAARLLLGQRYAIWSGAIHGERDLLTPLRRLQRGVLARFADGAIVLSSRARRYHQGLGVPRDRLFLACNSGDSGFFLEPVTPERRADRFTFIYVGRISRRKGVDRLLTAVARAVALGADIELICCGLGAEQELLEQQATALGLADRIQFLGQVGPKRLRALYQGADCFVFPTRHDIWGLVLNEAMASGLPVLVSPQAGAAEDLVEEGENGYVIDFDDADAVAQRMYALQQDVHRTQQLGARARSTIETRVNMERFEAAWADAIRDLLSAPTVR